MFNIVGSCLRTTTVSSQSRRLYKDFRLEPDLMLPATFVTRSAFAFIFPISLGNLVEIFNFKIILSATVLHVLIIK